MKGLLHRVEERTGIRTRLQKMLYESIPGGAGWRHVWGNTVIFCFAVQVITGFALWMAYSPSTQSAWESVFFIQHKLAGGWLLRGIHHFMADVMVVVLALHLIQMIIRAAYRPPNEFVFWSGLGVMLLVAGIALTGYLLPWDQHGYWGTKVRVGYLGLTPVVGPALQRLVMGGADLGNYTLTRFFALHAGLLPALMLALLGVRCSLNKRNGSQAGIETGPSDAPWWPNQAMRDAAACLAVMAFVLLLIFRGSLFGSGVERGAPLSAPADPDEVYAAARPEWYFLFLYRFLKFFPGAAEVWGAVIIPGVVFGLIAMMPFLGGRRSGLRFNSIFCGCLAASMCGLTLLAIVEDHGNVEHQLARKSADQNARRAAALALSPSGIPATGALSLMRSDPLTRGPRLFARHCSSCHRYDGHDGLGNRPAEPQSASDLKGFASREWLTGLLNPGRVSTGNYFGATKFRNGKMVRFVKRDVSNFNDQQREALRKGIKALSAGAALPAQAEMDSRDEALITEGRALLAGDLTCTDCHPYPEPDDLAGAPSLVGYGSREWLMRFVGNPGHADLYGSRNDRMPAFLEDQILDESAIGLIVDWLRGDWYEPAEGQGETASTF